MMIDWALEAACRFGDADALFVTGARQQHAKRICQGCPVRYECLAEALDGRVEWGVWGGLTESERDALLRRHPEVPSWRRLFRERRVAYRAGVVASRARTAQAAAILDSWVVSAARAEEPGA